MMQFIRIKGRRNANIKQKEKYKIANKLHVQNFKIPTPQKYTNILKCMRTNTRKKIGNKYINIYWNQQKIYTYFLNIKDCKKSTSLGL